jgi:hypothetical protein
MQDNYQIRVMKKDEIESIAVEWAAREGWNPGLYDLNSFYATDPKGFFIGILNDKPISCISAVSYDSTFGFVGFYIVIPEERGKGYGYKIWQKALKHFTSENIGLDGVVAQQDSYKKSGFKLAYRNIRYEGVSRNINVLSPYLQNFDDSLFELVLNYDLQVFPTKRTSFLKEWFKQPESYIKVFMKNKELKGYGMLRKCRSGYKVGPLFADNFEISTEILNSLISSIPEGQNFYLDTPELNYDAIKLAELFGMKYVFETARMYTKEVPKIDIKKLFGVTTFELG